MMFRVLSPFSYCLAAAGLFMSGQTAMRAQSSVKFQVDMSVQISNGNFVPGSSTVYARGTFNNYDTSLALTTNQNGTTPTIYSGTVSITDAPGTDEAYKFYIDTGDLWESPASTGGDDRHFTLAAGAQTLPVVYFDDLPPNVPTNNVTFQVDMTQQVVLGKFVPGSSTVYARGAFDNWSTDFPLTNNPAGANTNLFSGTYAVVAPVGSVQEYKFFNSSDTYELPGQPNRRFTIAGGNQILPAVYFSDQAPGRPNVTNNVTFQVDMSAQVAVGNFTPGADSVEARGSFNNWSSGVALTNNPGGQNTNLYSGVLQIIDQAGATNQYKYAINGSGYEQPASTGGGNRSFVLLTTNGSLTLPAVFFSDATTNDLLLADTEVTFQVNMANAVGTDAH